MFQACWPEFYRTCRLILFQIRRKQVRFSFCFRVDLFPMLVSFVRRNQRSGARHRARSTAHFTFSSVIHRPQVCCEHVASGISLVPFARHCGRYPFAELACDRDYKALCPMGFVSIGAVHGGKEEYCVASSLYEGPCRSDAYVFESMTPRAKARWSSLCHAFWPCSGVVS